MIKDKRIYLLIPCAILIIVFVTLQSRASVFNEITKITTFGGTTNDNYYEMDETKDGGYIVVGGSSSNDIDVEGLSKGSSDAIIVKYDGQGNKLWNKNFGGTSYDIFRSVVTADDGGYVAVGYSQSNDGDLDLLNHGGEDGIIVKFDRNGNVLWKHTYGGSGYDCFLSIAKMIDGGYVVVGSSGSSNGDLATLNQGSDDGIIVKYDTDGNMQWRRNLGGSSLDELVGVIATSDGGFLSFGEFWPTNAGQLAGLASKGVTDAVVFKHDASGNVEWKKNFGGNAEEGFRGALEVDDGYVLVGTSNSTNGDLSGESKGHYDAIIVKYTLTGNMEWRKVYGGETHDRFYKIIQTSDGGFAIAGESYSVGDDLSGYNLGSCDAILLKYNQNWELDWHKNFGGTGKEYLYTIIEKWNGFVAIGTTSSNDKDLTGLNKKGDYENINDVSYHDGFFMMLGEIPIVENYEYLVILLDEDYDGVYQTTRWKKDEQIIKGVYATTSYLNNKIKIAYDEIIDEYDKENKDSPVFGDIWVRIKIEETFTQNGNEHHHIVKNYKDATGKLVSSIDYFELISDDDTTIITLDQWAERIENKENLHGRFWIFDEETGWLYWAQPLQGTTYIGSGGVAIADQTTDHIIDNVKLTTLPSGNWDYKITATLDAMDIRLDGYNNEGAWDDIAMEDSIYELFKIDETEVDVPEDPEDPEEPEEPEDPPCLDVNGNVKVNACNFPDRYFRTYVATEIDKDGSATLSESERSAVIKISFTYEEYKEEIEDVTGIEYFPNLYELRIDETKAKSIDLSQNTKIYYLSLTNNTELTEVNLTGLKNVQYLYTYGSSLRELDVSTNTALVTLFSHTMPLERIDVSANTKLTSLRLYNTLLTEIDVSKNIELTDLRVYGCKLTEINVDNNIDLDYFDIRNNFLTHLDVSKVPKITKVNANFRINPQFDPDGGPNNFLSVANGNLILE